MGRTQLFCCRARFHCLLCLFTVFSTNPVRSSERCRIAQFFFIYRKIPKISPGAYIFQRPFLRVLFLEGLIFGILRYFTFAGVKKIVCYIDAFVI